MYCLRSRILRILTPPPLPVGGRFTLPAESHYSPTEGECLAVAVDLEQSKFYTLGCPRLYIATDHKPLVSILCNRALDTIAEVAFKYYISKFSQILDPPAPCVCKISSGLNPHPNLLMVILHQNVSCLMIFPTHFKPSKYANLLT